MSQRCLKNMTHEEETIAEYGTHIVKQCLRCKVKRWVATKTAPVRSVPIREPLRTCI
jgi:hypothetical protein